MPVLHLPINWKKVTHFSKDEQIYYNGKMVNAWGNPKKINPKLVYNLDALRIQTGVPIHLTSPAFVDSGHSNKSQHYKGNAADTRPKGISYLEYYLACERFQFTGLGLYDTGFIHLDVRPKDYLQSRWIRIDGKYLAFNKENFLKVMSIVDKLSL